MTYKDNTTPTPPFPCNECSAGIMHARNITYFTWLGKELITVPRFPAWVCDVCGKREYDARSVAWLNMLLDPNTGNSTLKKRKTRLHIKARVNSQRPILDS